MKKQIRIKQNKANIFFVIIGHLLVYSAIYMGAINFVIWCLKQITVYR